MKRKNIGVLLLGIIAMASLVWYGCTKENDSESESAKLGTIYGTVTDYATGEPINNANVKLKPSGETTLTGSDGSYEFRDLKADKYTLFLSKAEYADLDDDYVIELEGDKKVRRDVQMRKNIASLKVTDMSGNDLSSLDFGLEESVTSKSFNIFNNGTVGITVHLSYNCAWIDTVIALSTEITPGQTLTVTVIIDRSKLSAGENATFLHIISANGSNELKVTATGQSAPTVTTSSVTDITATSAKCGGNVTSDGGTRVTDRGICWGTNNMPKIDDPDVSKQKNGEGQGSFTITMSRLTPNTVYYVRAYATNARGTEYGEQRQFTTTDGTPTVVLSGVSDITATSAVGNGSISDNGGYAITKKGFVWSTSQHPRLNDCIGHTETTSGGDAPFTASMNSLSIGTTYYVCAYASNSQGTGYSEQRSFTTGNGLPTVTTTAITMNGDVAMSGGNVTSDGGYRVTARGICYGVYENPDLSSAYTHTNNGSGTGPFSAVIDNSSNGTIYVRAYATNENGTAYGEQKILNLDYMRLPTFIHNGHTYRVAPMNTSDCTGMSYNDAKSYCDNLTLYGYDDWTMPTHDELITMRQKKDVIGGFANCFKSCYYYQSNTYASFMDWSNGECINGRSNLRDSRVIWSDYSNLVRPIRKED